MLIFLALLVIGCFAALLFTRFKWITAGLATYLFCVLLFPPQVKIFGFSPSTIFSYFLFAISLYYGIKNKLFTQIDNKKIMAVLLVYMSVYLFLLPLGAGMDFLEPDQKDALKIFVLDVFPFAFFSYLLRNSRQVESILKYISVVGLFVFVYGVYSYATQQNLYIMLVSAVYSDVAGFEKMLEESRGGLEGRLGGTIGNPVFYSGLLLILFYFILGLYLKLSKKQFFWKLILLASMGGLFMNVFFSGSRSSLVALFLGFGCFCLKWWSKARLAISFTAVVFVLILGMSFPVFGKYQVFVDSIIYFWDDSKSKGEIKGSSVAMRQYQLEGLADVVGAKGAVFGLGAGWISKYIHRNGMHPVLLGFESLFFNAVTQYGIVGFFLLYLLFFLAMLHLCWHYKQLSRIGELDFWFMSCFVFSYVVYAFMTGPYFWGLFLCGYALLLKYFLYKNDEQKKLLNFMKVIKVLKDKKTEDAQGSI